MRSTLFVFAPIALLMTATAPASGQVRADLHIDIPILGHGAVVHHVPPPRDIVIYDYPPVPYGQWKKHYRDWNRVTLYVLDGRYYERPIRGGRAVIVYRDRDRYFWGPRDGDWGRWDRWDRNDRWDRDDRYRERDRRDDRWDDRGRRDDRRGDGRDYGARRRNN